jgi:predicted nuclease of predicted toxin-antitoxin system
VNLLADESIDRQIVERLRQDGHRVPFVEEMEPGIADDAVLSRANQDGAMLSTVDKDFGDRKYSKELPNNFAVVMRHSVRIRRDVQ